MSYRQIGKTLPNKRGFTLLELSIVLTLIGVILGMGLVILTATTQAAQFNTTVARMDAIHKMVLNFAVANDRIPCPGDLTLTTSSANYGYEAGAGSGSSPGVGTGVCSGGSMSPVANNVASSGTAEGAVPTRALKLSDDYMYDGWGRKIRYAVDPTYTVAGSLPVTGVCTATATPDASAITVDDASGAARTSMGAYALVSHGANGHGAYTSGGVMMNTGSTNTAELGNCNCSSAGVANATYVPTYVQKAPTIDPTTTTDNFDDIVTYRDAWQLQQANFQVTATSCAVYVYVSDLSLNNIQKFNSSGTYITTIASSGSGNGQVGSPAGLAIDSSHNIWLADNGNWRIKEYNSSGTWEQNFSSGYGSANGQLGGPAYVAFDSNNNLWVTDSGNQRVEEFNSSGSWVQSIGGPSPYTCETSPAGSLPACAAGNGNGQFGSNGDLGIAIDNNGNVWVVDTPNNRMEKFNSSGTYLLSVGASYQGVGGSEGTAGSSNGEFNHPTSVAVDASNNIWVCDAYNDRLEEFNTSGTYEGKFSMSAAGCQSIAIDISGNFWMTGYGGYTIYEFNKSGTLLFSFGTQGTGAGQLEGAWGIAVGSQ
jgi:prepilin-type N-terminal cleavage/methylation domain-containing protein